MATITQQRQMHTKRDEEDNDDEDTTIMTIAQILILVPITQSSKNKKKLMNKTPHKQKPDFDNLAKAFCDSFGIDDSHVWNARISKFWGYKGAIIIYDNIN